MSRRRPGLPVSRAGPGPPLKSEDGSTRKVYVSGVTASNDDTASALFAKIPLFLAVVIALGFVLLAAAFCSVLTPRDRRGHERLHRSARLCLSSSTASAPRC
jgi:hypothetical protein